MITDKSDMQSSSPIVASKWMPPMHKSPTCARVALYCMLMCLRENVLLGVACSDCGILARTAPTPMLPKFELNKKNLLELQ